MASVGRITVVGALIITLGWACTAVRTGQRGDRPDHITPSYAVPAADGAALRFAIIGDYGVDSQAQGAVARLVKSWNPAFVVTAGDNNYPLGLSLTIDRNIGKYYAEFIGGYAGSYGKGATENRFWPSPGNHDWYGPTGLSPYVDYFDLPGNERYYRVDLGLLELFVLDSDEREPDGITVDSKQAQWLKQALQQSRACYRMVVMHHPPYSSGAHGNHEALQWPYRAWGVDVVVAGHDHTYERLEVGGLPYVVNGLGGAPLYNFKDVLDVSKLRYNATSGAQLVTVTTEAMTLELRDLKDGLVDSVRLEKRCGAQ